MLWMRRVKSEPEATERGAVMEKVMPGEVSGWVVVVVLGIVVVESEEVVVRGGLVGSGVLLVMGFGGVVDHLYSRRGGIGDRSV